MPIAARAGTVRLSGHRGRRDSPLAGLTPSSRTITYSPRSNSVLPDDVVSGTVTRSLG